MNERFRERLGYLSDELDGSLRSVSPQVGGRSPRPSRSPRPPKDSFSMAMHDSRPNIAAWPAPPTHSVLAQHLTVNTSQSVQSSSPAMSPNTSVGRPGPYEDISDSASLITMLRVAAANDTSSKLQGREVELKRKIQTLEDTVAEYERQKYNVMGTFTEYRERVAEREKKLEAEYSGKIIALSEEVLGAKKDFEARMKSFQALQEKFEREKEQALEKLRQEHQKEIQLLEQRFSESQLLNLEQKYMIEIQRLEEERKSLRSEKERLGETFEMKLRRAQSLYETELAAAKMLYSRELEALRDHEEALKEELLARQEEFHDRLQELQHQAKRSRDELSNCKNEVTALEKKLHSKEAEVQQISQELEEARNETNDALRRLSELETEITETRQKHSDQEDELRRKSNMLDVVEAAKSKLEAVIRDLQAEVKTLKKKVDFLEKERQNLQSQSESQTQLQNSQVHALEAEEEEALKVLETVTKEKEATKEHYEGLLTKERQQADAREHSMKKEFSCKLNELEEQYTALKEELEHSAKIDKDELREATEQELISLRAEKNALSAEVEALKAKYIDGDEDKDEVEKKLEEVIQQTKTLSECIEHQREKISVKDEEILKLRKKVEEENQCTEDQLMALREEVKHELVIAGASNEIEELHAKIAELEVQCEKDEQELEEDAERIRKLEEENQTLKKEMKKRSEEEMRNDEEGDRLKDEEKAEIEERCSRIMKEKEDNMKKEFEAQRTRLLSEIASMKKGKVTSEKNLVEMQAKCESLLEEVESIKGELKKKNELIENYTKSTDELRSDDAKRALALEEELLEEQKNHVKVVEKLRKDQEAMSGRIEELQEALETKQRELEETRREKDIEMNEQEVQTDEMKREEPKAIVDLARERELTNRIIEMEATLTQKDSIITELHERLDAVLLEEMPKKKDRSASVGGEHSLKCTKAASKFQTLVNSMTDHKSHKKDEEAKAKKKELERAVQAAKEKSPSIQRSKSPSLLTRLRERSPGKSKQIQQQQQLSMEAGPSSSRSLLSPSDAELMQSERRGSPSRTLFSRSKKESSTTPGNEKRPAWKI